jgi:hypothetical protein
MPNSNVSSPGDVANLALGNIGHTQFLDTLDEDSVEGSTCKRFFGQARDEILRDAVWPFAIKHSELAPLDPSTLENGVVPQSWRFAFAQPKGCIRLHGVFPFSTRLAADAARDAAAQKAGATPSRWNDNGFRIWHRNPALFRETRYVRESDDNVGQIVLTDEAQPIFEYTRATGKFLDGVFTDDVTQWDSDFVSAVAYRLGHYIAGPLAKDMSKAAEQFKLSEDALAKASANAAQEIQKDPDPPPAFIRARRWGR